MKAFIILSLLYFLLLPLSYVCWLKWKLKIWQRMRRLVRTRFAVYKLYHATQNFFFTDMGTIFDILTSDIDFRYALYKYRSLYGISLIDDLRDELNEDDFNKALCYINNKTYKS